MQPCSTIQRLRKPKVFDMSVFDWITSLLLAGIVGYFLKLRGFAWVLFIAFWILFGVLVHLYFGINTMLGYYLGLNPKPIREECL
jgi:hypothetical protein